MFLSTQQTGVYQNSSGITVGRKWWPRISSKKQWIRFTVLVLLILLSVSHFFKIYQSIRSRSWSLLIFWQECQNSAAANSDQISWKKTQIKKRWRYLLSLAFFIFFNRNFAGGLLHRNSGRKRRWIQKLVERIGTELKLRRGFPVWPDCKKNHGVHSS